MTRSFLETRMRSAKPTCFWASSWASRVAMPCLASTTVTTASRR
ncbi:Uncharacterised protein [Bordetella pertussis]|nr:Uncharacterised protein [Bordetella pertussis]